MADHELCKNGRTDRDVVGNRLLLADRRNRVLDGGPDPHEREPFYWGFA